MSRARDNADLGDSYGSLGAGVTGGSGLNALGTVTAGNLSNSAIIYPAGHVIGSSFSNSATEYTLPASFPNTQQGLSVHHTCMGSGSLFLVIVSMQTLLQQTADSQTGAIFSKIMAHEVASENVATAVSLSGNFRTMRNWHTTTVNPQIGTQASMVWRGTVGSINDDAGDVIDFWIQSYRSGANATGWMSGSGIGNTITVLEIKT
tara:strand:- start:494 stop:1108 length:615 start_codon:yes stop_codon:yes gene_type:complete